MSKDGSLGAFALIDRHKLLAAPIRIKVFPAKTLAVTFKDALTGKPIAGIDVTLEVWLGRSGDYGGKSTTDAGGMVLFSNIFANGSYSVYASAKGYRTYRTLSPHPVVGSKGWKPVQVVKLEKADMAKGRVVDQQGKPVAGAEVEQVSWEKTNATTDADGNFEVPVPAEDNIAWDERLGKPVVMLKVSHGGRDIGAVATISRAELFAKGITITARPAQALTVVIKDTEGKPLKGVEIEAFLEYGQGGQGASLIQRTSDAGEVVISSLYHGGTYDLMTELTGYYRPISGNLGPAGSEKWKDRVEFVMERTDRTQRGTVVDDEGTPIVGATVTCSAIRSLQATTGAGGAFTLKGLPASKVTLYASFSQLRGSAQVSKDTPSVIIKIKEPAKK